MYLQAGKYNEAEPILKQCLVVFEKSLGPDHPVVAEALSNLAVLYVDRGRFAAAEPLIVRAMGVREKALGPEHPEVAASLNNLAILYRNQGRYAEAEPLHRRASRSGRRRSDPCMLKWRIASTT